MKKVLVGMSGGVDSSVAALLLKEQGYEVHGVTLVLYKNSDEDARQVCDRLNIGHTRLDLSELFKKTVIDPFTCAYIEGKTPNPCIFCNKSIKFGAMADYARDRGFDFIATGHYAKITKQGDEYLLQKADDPAKDQSYVLYNMNQELLSRTLFPLADLSKARIRQLAEDHGLICAKKPDSQDICFVPDGDYAAFITRETGYTPPPGCFIDREGKVLGEHRGIIKYTIGQRSGLGMGFGSRRYVLSKNPETNEITLGDNEELFSSALKAEHCNFISGRPPLEETRITAKTRYKQRECPALLSVSGTSARVTFEQPQRAPTAGQSVVFYDNNTLLGGGIIL